MSYSISRTPEFSKHLKQIAKKYPSLKNDYLLLLDSLLANPAQGDPLGKNCYKVRWKITSKQTGKSEVQESSLMSGLKTTILPCLMYMIKLKKNQSQKKN